MATITLGSLAGQFHTGDDADWFKLQLQADKLYTFTASNPDTPAQLVLHGAQGQVVGALSNFGGSGPIAFMPSASGTYYLSVQGLAAPLGSYRYTVQTVDDDHLSTVRASTTLNAGATVSGVLNAAGDEDWFKVSLTANTLYRFTGTPNTAGALNLFLAVLDTNGQVVNEADSAGNANGVLSFSPSSSGTYFVSVLDVFGVTGGYSLALQTVADDFSDAPNTTGRLALNGTASGVLNAKGDHDWFEVNLTANTLYAMAPAQKASLAFQVYDAQGVAVNQSDAFSYGVLGFTPTTTGRYFVGVSDPLGQTTDYAIALRSVAEDFPSNTSTSGVLAAGTPVSGKVNTSADVDWLRVNLQANQLVGFAVTVLSAPTLQVFDAQGQPVLKFDALTVGNQLSFSPSTSGTYYLSISAGSSLSNTGATYSASLTPLADDFPSTTATPGTLAVGGSTSGVFNSEQDHDWLKVNLQADTLYRFDSSDTEIAFYLSDGSGVTLAELLSSSAGTGGTLSFTPSTSGTYYLGVVGSALTADTYTVTLNTVADDFTDNIRTTGALTPASTVPGNTVNGTAGNDQLRGTAGNDVFNGGAGRDEVIYSGARSAYAFSIDSNGVITVNGPDGVDTLNGVERLVFSDRAVGFDIEGTGGKAYRLYQAAFDRQPDLSGLGFWTYYLDRDFKLQAAADNFLKADEFTAMYGTNPTNEEYVRLLYVHVHHREPDAGGNQFWLDAMANKDGAFGKNWSRGDVLVEFAESRENKANLLGVMQGGFEYGLYTP